MKVASYKCDSCGSAINNPYDIKMKEFTYTRAIHGNCFRWIPFVSSEKIHLCSTCFDNLRNIAEHKTVSKDEYTLEYSVPVEYAEE